MKIVDCPYDKGFVFDLYRRIYPDFKNYDKITKKKMIIQHPYQKTFVKEQKLPE